MAGGKRKLSEKQKQALAKGRAMMAEKRAQKGEGVFTRSTQRGGANVHRKPKSNTQSGGANVHRKPKSNTQSGGANVHRKPKTNTQSGGAKKKNMKKVQQFNILTSVPKPMGASPETVEMIRKLHDSGYFKNTQMSYQTGNGIGSSLASGIRTIGNFIQKNPDLVKTGMEVAGGIANTSINAINSAQDRALQKEMLKRRMLGF